MITKEYYMKNISELTKMDTILAIIDDNLRYCSYETDKEVYIGLSGDIDSKLINRACMRIKRDTDWSRVYLIDRAINESVNKDAYNVFKRRYGTNIYMVCFVK